MSNPTTTKLFNHPKIYKLIYGTVQESIRKKFWSIIKQYIINEEVIEYGSGYYSYLFDPSVTKKYTPIDIMPEAIKAQGKGIVADVTKPCNFPKADAVLITAILHHTGKHDLVLNNAKKHADTIIIFDNIRNDNLFLAAIQMFYFSLLDKGNSYPTSAEWDTIFRTSNLTVIQKIRFGWLFGHLGIFVLRKN